MASSRAFRYVLRDVMCSNFLSPGLACGSNPGRRPTRDESVPSPLNGENYPLFGTSPRATDPRRSLSPVFTDFGVEKKASLEGLDEKAVQAAVTNMLK